MKPTRRDFLKTTAAGTLGSSFMLHGCRSVPAENTGIDYSTLDLILEQPVLKRDLFPDPVILERVELLEYRNNFLCRVVSSEGVEGISVSNNAQIISLYPIFLNRLQPFFIGKDARDWEKLLDEVYVYMSNYKLQSLALWVPLATLELAVLDLLGKIAGKSMGELIGNINNPYISVYRANNFRGRPAAESVELIRQQVKESNARALKIKVGGRMSNNADYPPGRTEQLIPLVRKTFGEEITIYADSNGSYTIDEAVRIGRIMEEHRIDFFEDS